MTLPKDALVLCPVPGAKWQTPVYATTGSAAFDLHAHFDEGENHTATIQPGERLLISMGFVMAIAPGYWGHILPRSGLAYKNGIQIMAGVIDSDYRGEVKALLLNSGAEPVTIHYGDRIAQMVIAQVSQPTIHVVSDISELPETERGAGGFGSTGVAAVA